MTEKRYNIPGEPDEQLNWLVGEAGRSQERPFDRPEDQAIEAYILGTATKEQRRQVQAALLASSLFRRELIALSRDLQRLQDPKIRGRVETVDVPPAPDIENLLRVQDKDLAGHNSRNEITSRRRLSRPFELPRLVPTLAIAAALVVIAVNFLPQAPTGTKKEIAKPPAETGSSGGIVQSVQLASLVLIDSSVEPGLVAALDLRSAPSSPRDADSIFTSDKEAACASLRRLVTLDINHNYQLSPRNDSVISLDSISGGEKYTLEFALENDTTKTQLAARLPSAKNPGTNLSIWVLDLEHRTLSRATLLAESCTVILPIKNRGTFAVVYTISTSRGFRSGAIGCIRLGTESSK